MRQSSASGGSAERALVREVAPLVVAPGTLITARSYLVDRIAPDCEIVALPAKTVAGGTLASSLRPGARADAPPPGGRMKRMRGMLSRGASEPAARPGRVVVDMRHHDPSNWAHLLNNHLPLLFRLCADHAVPVREVVPVLPADARAYVVEGVRLFGLDPLLTDGAVEGTVLSGEMSPWTGMRPARAGWAREAPPCAPGSSAPMPERAFLARRGTRVVSNAAEVEALIGPMGFETVYPEDLPAADQMRLFREAREIVAVHGAGLAPLLYADGAGRGGRLERLVEILPCGHMTDVYRVMCQQVGVDWIGVRGRLKPEYVRPAYRLSEPFRTFSLDSFEVDPVSLGMALEWGTT